MIDFLIARLDGFNIYIISDINLSKFIVEISIFSFLRDFLTLNFTICMPTQLDNKTPINQNIVDMPSKTISFSSNGALR